MSSQQTPERYPKMTTTVKYPLDVEMADADLFDTAFDFYVAEGISDMKALGMAMRDLIDVRIIREIITAAKKQVL